MKWIYGVLYGEDNVLANFIDIVALNDNGIIGFTSKEVTLLTGINIANYLEGEYTTKVNGEDVSIVNPILMPDNEGHTYLVGSIYNNSIKRFKVTYSSEESNIGEQNEILSYTSLEEIGTTSINKLGYNDYKMLPPDLDVTKIYECTNDNSTNYMPTSSSGTMRYTNRHIIAINEDEQKLYTGYRYAFDNYCFIVLVSEPFDYTIKTDYVRTVDGETVDYAGKQVIVLDCSATNNKAFGYFDESGNLIQFALGYDSTGEDDTFVLNNSYLAKENP